MAKKPKALTDEKIQTVRVLTLFQEGPAFGYREYEIPETIFKKHAEVIDQCSPDFFSIFVNNITKKSREWFGI